MKKRNKLLLGWWYWYNLIDDSSFIIRYIEYTARWKEEINWSTIHLPIREPACNKIFCSSIFSYFIEVHLHYLVASWCTPIPRTMIGNEEISLVSCGPTIWDKCKSERSRMCWDINHRWSRLCTCLTSLVRLIEAGICNPLSITIRPPVESSYLQDVYLIWWELIPQIIPSHLGSPHLMSLWMQSHKHRIAQSCCVGAHWCSIWFHHEDTRPPLIILNTYITTRTNWYKDVAIRKEEKGSREVSSSWGECLYHFGIPYCQRVGIVLISCNLIGLSNIEFGIWSSPYQEESVRMRKMREKGFLGVCSSWGITPWEHHHFSRTSETHEEVSDGVKSEYTRSCETGSKVWNCETCWNLERDIRLIGISKYRKHRSMRVIHTSRYWEYIPCMQLQRPELKEKETKRNNDDKTEKYTIYQVSHVKTVKKWFLQITTSYHSSWFPSCQKHFTRYHCNRRAISSQELPSLERWFFINFSWRAHYRDQPMEHR